MQRSAVRVCEGTFGGMLLMGVSGNGSGSKWSDKVEKREVVDKKEQLRGRRKEDLQRNEGGRWRRRREWAGPVGKKENKKEKSLLGWAYRRKRRKSN